MPHLTDAVRQTLAWYEGERPGVKANLSRMLMHGRAGGSGKLVILPVDQGFEHGPARSFAVNPSAYDPCYHQACDTFDNNSDEAIDIMSDAAAHTVLTFAMMRAPVNAAARVFADLGWKDAMEFRGPRLVK